MRLIDADALIAGLERSGVLPGFAKFLIKKAPTIEPVKRGKWICEPQKSLIGTGEYEIDDYYRCSVCDYGLTSDATPYCPNCGADVRLEAQP